MTTLRVHLEGIGLCTPSLADFDALRGLLTGEMSSVSDARPAATTLSIHERRRAPESVRVAIEAASQAVTMSQRPAGSLPCVFASAYGDQATTDYMCRVLAHTPHELSPTRFHNSVHNASAGYWTIATHSQVPSSAVCAGQASFGAGLLEAAAQACAEQRAVLLVCSDTAGVGPLGELIGCTFAFGVALVLSPCSDASAPQLNLEMVTGAPEHSPLPASCMEWMRENPSAACLPLLAMLADGKGQCVLPAFEQGGLLVKMETLT